MIQIRCLREFIPPGETQSKKFDKAFSPDLVAESHEKLFENLETLLQEIPDDERYNCFFTVGHTEVEQKKRSQTFQSAIFFDIDGVNEEKIFDYIPAIEKALLVKADDILILFSGHGLHILIQTTEHIFEKSKDYEVHRVHYQLVSERIHAALLALGLPGKVDTQVFAPNRFVRLPETLNKKEGKEPKDVYTLTRGFKELPFNLKALSMGGVPEVPASEQLEKREFSHLKLDEKTIEKECRFLDHAREQPETLSEPQWYGALSFLARLSDGEKKCHEYSKGHPNYSEHATSLKIKQALQASGPRTCANISTMWAGCKDCPHFGKIKTPLSLKSDDFIQTEEAGFYRPTAKGGLEPAYADLLKFFGRKHAFRTHQENGQVYIFDQTHYREFYSSQLRNFAATHMRPTPKDYIAKEFLSWVTRSHLIGEEWFKQTNKLINFKNGVLDTETGNILAHSPEYGFLYCLPFDYDPTAKAPHFEKFLKEVTCEEKNLATLILEFIGYALCDREYWIQKGMIFVGGGANGKTTLLKIIEMVAGEKNYSAISMNDFQNENHRSQLEGKLMNICDELPISTVKNTEMFKKLMGGTVTMRRLYTNVRQITNMAKFFFSCNELPDIYDRSNGLFRRLIIIPFQAQFSMEKGTADPGILKRISKELPGVFNLAYEAYRGVLKRGHMTESESATTELKAYKSDLNWMEEWFYETFEVLDWKDKENFIHWKVFFEKYINECQQSGERSMSKRKFFSQVRSFLPRFDKRCGQPRENGERPRVLYGVRFHGKEPAQKISQM